MSIPSGIGINDCESLLPPPRFQERIPCASLIENSFGLFLFLFAVLLVCAAPLPLTNIAVQEGSFIQAPATVQALARFRPEPKEDPVKVARAMEIPVPITVANSIRRSADDSMGHETPRASRSAGVLQVGVLLETRENVLLGIYS